MRFYRVVIAAIFEYCRRQNAQSDQCVSSEFGMEFAVPNVQVIDNRSNPPGLIKPFFERFLESRYGGGKANGMQTSNSNRVASQAGGNGKPCDAFIAAIRGAG